MEVLIMEEIINLIVTNGMSAVIIGYMLFKDFKFNQQIIDVLDKIEKVLIRMGGDTEC